MKDKKDGGNAFPVLKQHAFSLDILGSTGGMTLRQYYAAKAMQGMIANLKGFVGVNNHEKTISECAFVLADAMIAAEQEDGK